MSDSSKRFLKCASVLPVDDAVATAEFYRDTLGFEIAFTWGDPPYYAIVARGDGVGIHLSEREDTSRRIQPCSVYIFVDDVDAVYEEYKTNGLEMFAPPEDQEYGMREFEVRDMNGHFLTFGQRLQADPPS